MVDQHLSVRVSAGSNADGRNAEGLGEQLGHLGRHALDHDGKGARLLQCERVGEQRLCCCNRLSLRAEPAQHGDALRGESDVAHDGHAAAHQ